MKIKKFIMILVILIVSGILFAQSLSIGTNISIAPTWTNAQISVPILGNYEAKDVYAQLAFGLFFDATYIQAGISYIMAAGDYNLEENYFGLITDKSYSYNMSSIGFSLIGKYPITLGRLFSIFPLFGFEYQYMFSARVANYTANSEMRNNLSDFYLLCGFGSDINLTNRFYIRGNFLLGFNLTAKDERIANILNRVGKIDSVFGGTFKFIFALGYKL